MPDQRHRHLDPSDPEIRRARAARIICCQKCCRPIRRAVEGHAVHDRARRRLRRRQHRDGGEARERHVAAFWRQMVLLACRRRRRAAAGAARGRAGRHQGPRAVRAAAAARGRQPQRLSHRAAEGQARHPLDGLGRNPAGGRRCLARRRGRPGPQADDGAGQPVAAVAWRARRRDDAPLRQRGDDLRADAAGVRADHHRLSAAAPSVDEDRAAGGTGAVDVPVRRACHGPRQCGRCGGRRASCAS